MTVSRVVNRTGYVSEETRDKVLLAIKKLNYRRNASARSLRRQKTDTIGLVLGDLANPFSAELAMAVRETLASRGYHLLISISEHSGDEDVSAIDTLVDHNVDGLVVATRSDPGGDSRLRDVVEDQLPLVVIGRDFKHESVDSVAADTLAGGFEATQHLIDLGHQRVAFLGAALNDLPGLKRLQGYTKALDTHGIPIDERLVTGRNESALGGTGYSTEKIGYEGMKRLLSVPKRPTAIFARNDFTAIGAMTAIKEARLTIPKDIAIVGFDDIPMATHTSPPLTTVRQPMRMQGQLAAEMMLKRVTGEGIENRTERLLTCELIIRGSTVSTEDRRG